MVRALRQAHCRRMVAVVFTFVALSGCTLSTDVSGPAAMLRFSGDMQTAPTNTLLPTSLAVIVVSQFGEPLQDVTVTWTIASGDGTLSATSTQTEATGVASVTYTTGATAGLDLIEARVSGLPPVTFSITVS